MSYWICRDCGRRVYVRWCVYCGRCWRCCAAKNKDKSKEADMTPAQDMATRRITNSLSYLAWIDDHIRWFREHPAKTAAAKRASKQSLALLAESRAKVVAMIRRIEAENGLENWSGLA